MSRDNSESEDYRKKPLTPVINIIPLGSEDNVVKFSLSGKSGNDYILSVDNHPDGEPNNVSGDESGQDFFSEPESVSNQQIKTNIKYFSDSETNVKKNTLSKLPPHEDNRSAQKAKHVVSGSTGIDEGIASPDPLLAKSSSDLPYSHKTSNPLSPNRSKAFINSGKSRIVLIKSTNNLNIFSNPGATLKFLENSGLNKFKSGAHEVQGRGGCLKLTINTSTEFDISKITKMGDSPVRAWFPASDRHSFGVIFPIDRNIPLDEVSSNLSIATADPSKISTSVVELKRLQNSDGPSDLIKITFDGPLPNRVVVSGQTYIVRKFKKDPLICYRCSKWGHGIISCTGSARCGLCGGNHFLQDCDKKVRLQMSSLPKRAHFRFSTLSLLQRSCKN